MALWVYFVGRNHGLWQCSPSEKPMSKEALDNEASQALNPLNKTLISLKKLPFASLCVSFTVCFD